MHLKRTFLVGMFTSILAAILSVGCSQSDFVAGTDPRDYIQDKLQKQEKRIVIPPGVYRLEQRAPAFLSLRDISDVILDFRGVTFIGLSTTTMLEMVNCKNVRILGLTIDYDPLPFTQGVIQSVDEQKNWIVEIIPGYPVENIRTNAGVDMRIQAYNPETEALVNPLRYGQGVKIERLGPRTFKVIGGGDRSGALGDIAVFNVLSFLPEHGFSAGAVITKNCTDVVFENVTLYSSAFMGFVGTGDSRTQYLGCVIDRCPPEKDYLQRGMKRLRSLNVDGFHVKNSVVGPRIERSVARYMADDCINISGMYSMVAGREGKLLRVISAFERVPDIHPGETLEIMALGGTRIPGAKVVSIVPAGRITSEESKVIQRLNLVSFYKSPESSHLKYTYQVELDAEVDVKFGDLVISSDRVGNGFVVKDNTFGPIRSRAILVKASKGSITGNSIVGAGGPSISIGPEYYWMEGSCGSEITISANVISDSNLPGIWISGLTGAGKGNLMPADSRFGISILENVIKNIPAPGILVYGCTDLSVKGNQLMLRNNGNPGIELKNVEGVEDAANTITFIGASPSAP